MSKSTTAQTLAVFWQHTKPYKRQLFIIYPTMAVAQLVEDFLSPVLIAGVLTALAAGNLEALTPANVAPVLLAVIACEIVGHLLWNRVVIPRFWRTQDAIMRDINMTIFNHLQTMSYRFYADRFAGSLVNQTNKFVGSFERLTDPLTWNVFKLLVALVATSVILAPKAPLVAVAIILISSTYAPLVWIYRRRQEPYNKRWAKSESRRTGQLADTITNIQAVKSFASEAGESKLMQDRVDDVHNRSIATMHLVVHQELITGFMQRAINMSVVVISILLAVSGQIDVGIIYLSLNFTMGLMRRLWDLNNTFRQFTRVFGDSHDMAEILQIEPEVADPEKAKPFTASNGLIEFSDVTFWYPEVTARESLFSNFSLLIKPGEKIGLVGPSGGGKTTVTKLLLRFMDIQDGSIAIDGREVRDMSQADLRKSITYVPQEPLLFHRSIRENIAYGNPTATDAEIVEAANKAHAHEFITNLAEGYDTLVGERGVKLSGGQKQRIAVARAMIKDAPIVVLDEATSALDSESEVAIQAAFKELLKHKTAVVIAHRLSTIQNMDRIIVLDKGKVVEEGTHNQLKNKKGGLYARLWQHQSGGFLQE